MSNLAGKSTVCTLHSVNFKTVASRYMYPARWRLIIEQSDLLFAIVTEDFVYLDEVIFIEHFKTAGTEQLSIVLEGCEGAVNLFERMKPDVVLVC